MDIRNDGISEANGIDERYRRVRLQSIGWDTLSDEHCAQICRFLKLDRWDRDQHERTKAYVRWKIENKSAMDKRDTLRTPEELQRVKERADRECQRCEGRGQIENGFKLCDENESTCPDCSGSGELSKDAR